MPCRKESVGAAPHSAWQECLLPRLRRRDPAGHLPDQRRQVAECYLNATSQACHQVIEDRTQGCQRREADGAQVSSEANVGRGFPKAGPPMKVACWRAGDPETWRGEHTLRLAEAPSADSAWHGRPEVADRALRSAQRLKPPARQWAAPAASIPVIDLPERTERWHPRECSAVWQVPARSWSGRHLSQVSGALAAGRCSCW
jgi:hypothetical protein